MKVTVNNKEVETFAQNISVLLREMDLDGNGMAVAVDGDIIPRSDWEYYALKENMKIVVIKAACGG